MIEVYSQNRNGTYFTIALQQQEIVASTFSGDQKTALENILCNLPFNVPFQIFHEPSPKAKTALQTLKDIYDGKGTNTALPLATKHLPPYTQKVLKATQAIPVGYVTSYGAIAKAVGGGARAVGNAMACNRFAPIVPCHRVVKGDLGLGGYGAGGLKVKVEFLRREKRGYTESKFVEVCGGRLHIIPVEHVLAKLA
ncbi:MAG: methylated-DNA--[protein]-cysteine S-methyltransferase [Candidatus Bathyarchaeota archaeon]|nr:methylated-DNA--[protein]-cysteine S-methyltransferase [Candidatus Bathyarchaeota archaeon]